LHGLNYGEHIGSLNPFLLPNRVFLRIIGSSPFTFKWRAHHLKVIREKCSEALHILDRFHIVAKMNKALDEVRAGESRRMATEGRVPVLRKSRWLLLKREENLKTEQRFRLRDLLRYNVSFRYLTGQSWQRKMGQSKGVILFQLGFYSGGEVPPASSDLGKGQCRERAPHGHDTVYLIFRRAVQPRIGLGRCGHASHCAPLPDLRAGFHRRSWAPPQTGS
jgi:hypothetical protein